jgi:hypothetical protein
MEYPLLRKREDKSNQVDYCAALSCAPLLRSSKRARDNQGENMEQAEETTTICLNFPIPPT